MTQKQAETLGNDYKTLIFARTGLKGSDLQCPREKSFMTPCVARDGGMCVVLDGNHDPLCVGCEALLEPLVKKERSLEGH